MKKIIIFIILFSFITQTYASNRFYFGHCTRYVANKKEVTWRGNAKDWLQNAYNQGYNIYKNPFKGAIIVFNGFGYNSKYGHVGIVRKITKEYIIISEMNYKKLNQITFRIIYYKTDQSIKGYIKV